MISFINEVRSYSPNPFPLAGQLRMIAALWTDIDTSRNGGRAYYRETTDADLLQRATDDVRSAFDALPQFNATWVFVATWHKVTYYGGSYSTPVSLCLFFAIAYVHQAHFVIAYVHQARHQSFENRGSSVYKQPGISGMISEKNYIKSLFNPPPPTPRTGMHICIRQHK